MKRLILAALGAAVLFSGCNSGTVPGPGSGKPVAVALSPSSSKGLDEGQTLNVTATVTNDSSDKGVTWTCTFGGAACAAAFSTSACTVSGTTQTCAATFTAPGSTGAVSISAASVADSTKSASLPFNVSAPPSVPPASSLPASCTGGTAGVAFDCAIAVSSGTGPFTWTATGLPAGLTLSVSADTKTATIIGTPSSTQQSSGGSVARRIMAASDPTVTVTVCDSGTPPVCSSVTFTITVALGITTTSLPSGSAGAVYSATISAGGGTTPYSWTVTGLPTGFTFTSGTPSVTITGTTVQTGNFTVTAMVTDSESPTVTVSATFTLTIAAAGTLTITTSTPLPGGTQGTAYSTTISATGGITPYTFSWAAATGSSLPPGLSISTNTSNNTGVISGTPTATGTFAVVVTVTDSESPTPMTDSVTFLLTITGSTSFTCPSPVNLTLCGGYSLAIRGFNSSNGATVFVAFFLADNSGNVVAGTEDFNSSTSASGAVTLTITGGSYVMDVSGDGRGVLTLIYSDGSSATFRFVVESAANANGLAEIEEFDASGRVASGIMVGPETPPVPAIPAGAVVDVPLEGYTSTGVRAALLGDFKVGSSGCNGASGSFNSLAGESVIVNVKGTVSKVTATGSCTAPDTSTGRGTITITISGGTPFTSSALHFVYYAVGSGSTIEGVVIGSTDAIGANQPILSGLASGATTGSITASALQSTCPCIFVGHATTDGTITTGHGVETVIRLVFTASTSTTGTFTGIEDQNSGGTITSAANISGSFTIDSNGVGTITPTGGSTIHFVVQGSDTLETADESTGVETGSARTQNSMTINSPGAPYIGGEGLAGGVGITPATANVVGVITPSDTVVGTTQSGTLSGTVDVSTSLGSLAGAAASGSYSIDTTTGRGTGTANLTGGASGVSVVIWIRRDRQFVVLDVQSGDSDPVMIGFRLR
jgi:Putative Ig domain